MDLTCFQDLSISIFVGHYHSNVLANPKGHFMCVGSKTYSSAYLNEGCQHITAVSYMVLLTNTATIVQSSFPKELTIDRRE